MIGKLFLFDSPVLSKSKSMTMILVLSVYDVGSERLPAVINILSSALVFNVLLTRTDGTTHTSVHSERWLIDNCIELTAEAYD